MLSALPYQGGKSVRGMGSGPWVAARLPYRSGYVEPFAGMLGVLLQRRPSMSETVNDTNGLVVNWWRVVRDKPEEFGRFLDFSPQRSRDEWDWAIGVCREFRDGGGGVVSDVELAYAYTVIVLNSVSKGNELNYGGFVCNWSTVPRFFEGGEVRVLGERIRRLQIENCDAVFLLEKLVNKEDLVIYCDPPYQNTRGYGRSGEQFEVDYEGLLDVLLLQKGLVALSGYGDEWDVLLEHGWFKDVKGQRAALGVYAKSDTHWAGEASYDTERVEALWTSFPPQVGSLFEDGSV